MGAPTARSSLGAPRARARGQYRRYRPKAKSHDQITADDRFDETYKAAEARLMSPYRRHSHRSGVAAPVEKFAVAWLTSSATKGIASGKAGLMPRGSAARARRPRYCNRQPRRTAKCTQRNPPPTCGFNPQRAESAPARTGRLGRAAQIERMTQAAVGTMGLPLAKTDAKAPARHECHDATALQERTEVPQVKSVCKVAEPSGLTLAAVECARGAQCSKATGAKNPPNAAGGIQQA